MNMYIYCLPIHNLTFTDSDTCLLKFVSSQRQDKILRYHFDIDQKLSLYSAILVRKVLSDMSGIPANKLLFYCQLNHKPELINLPQYKFSFSHTRNFILCCLSLKKEVGADVERIENPPYEIMEQVFHPEETLYVLSSKNPSVAFYEIWTKKEAYMKFLKTGLTGSLAQINTLQHELATSFLTWCEGNYMCSVYGDTPRRTNITHVSEIDINVYYDLISLSGL